MGFDPISFLLGSKAGGGGGGGSAWTKIAEKDFTVSTTSTSETNIGTVDLDVDSFAVGDIICCHIRDNAGKRNGYFYGSDGFVVVNTIYGGIGTVAKLLFTYADNNYSMAASAYGLYLSRLNMGEKTASIKAKYYSSYGTIDGTYKVDVYKLSPAAGMTPMLA